MTSGPRVEFNFEDDAGKLLLAAAKFRRDAKRAIAEAGFAGSMSVAVVSDRTMRRVNRDFHHCDEPTDVLAFALDGAPGFDAEIVVSLDTARREAKAHGVTAASELMLYVVHGTLHLCGHDDHALADARRMHARALSILDALGYRNTIAARAKSRAKSHSRTRAEKGRRE